MNFVALLTGDRAKYFGLVFELATERYVSGLESFLSVLDARRSLYAAEGRLASSETTVEVSDELENQADGGQS